MIVTLGGVQKKVTPTESLLHCLGLYMQHEEDQRDRQNTMWIRTIVSLSGFRENDHPAVERIPRQYSDKLTSH